jgi:UDP-N-acetylmuramyl pentapeptide phosphotransferase/UDP-N-acetylglucosamine-1-phosphate transferase
MKKYLILPITLCLLIIFSTLAYTQPRPKVFYPMVEIEVADPTHPSALSFLFYSRPNLHDCEALGGNLTRKLLNECPQCRVKLIKCETTLDKTQQNLLSDAPLDTASGSMSNGIVVFNFANQELALAACQANETRSNTVSGPIKCFPANTPRTHPHQQLALTPWSLILILAAFSAAWFVGWLIIKYEHLHAHISHDHAETGPQKYHTEPTPRIGGLMLFAGLLAAVGIMLISDTLIIEREFGLLLLASLSAFLGGFVEDLTKKVGVLERLLLTILSAAIASWLLGATLLRLDIGGVYARIIEIAPFFAIIFTIFAVGGIANAINIIDGYNGLAGGFSIIVLVALSCVAHQVGDSLIFSTSLALAGALMGFLAWNWPGGKIFLGDGGAYLTGFLLAVLAVLLVAHNPEVSPWFPLLLLIYPVFETLFSIYRRKLKHGLSPGQPDNKHLHQLIHDNIILNGALSDANPDKLDTNSRVAKYLWIPAVITSVLGCLFWQSTIILASLTAAYCVFYTVIYRRIARRGEIPAV